MTSIVLRHYNKSRKELIAYAQFSHFVFNVVHGQKMMLDSTAAVTALEVVDPNGSRRSGR